jgi:hypothetical protein
MLLLLPVVMSVELVAAPALPPVQRKGFSGCGHFIHR